RHVFGEIEIMNAGATCRFGYTDVAVEGQAGYDCIDRMSRELAVEALGVQGIELMWVQRWQAVRFDHGVDHITVDISKMHFIGTGVSEQCGDERSDLSCAEDQDTVHTGPPVREPLI